MNKKNKQGKKSGFPELSVLNNWYQFADEAAKNVHWEFFVIDQFVKGNHSISGNSETNTITVTKKQDTINFPINQIYTTFRAIRAFVTRHKPFVAVEPEESSQESRDYARRANKVLERDNQLNNYPKINKEWAHYMVKYGIGWRQIGYDPVKKCAIRWTVDPFDLLIGSKTGKAEDAPYLIKTLIRTVDYWKNKYPDCDVFPDDELAADEYKRLSMQIDFQTGTSAQELGQRTAIGKECWYRLYAPNSMGGYVNKVLFTKTEILSTEETPYDEFPFIAAEAEVAPNELYPEGHLKQMISPQRMLNMLNAQLLEYNHLVNRGRFVYDKNSGFSVINAKEGQMIRKNVGKNIQVLNPPAINPALPTQIDYALKFIQDIGAQQDASRGRLPSSGLSGDAIEALQVGDSNSISDLRDNFEDALSREAAWILKVYSLFEQDGVVLEDKLNEEKVDKFGIVGAKAYEKLGKKIPEKYYMEDNGEYCAVCAILPDNKVKISVNSQLGETKAARIELLMKLVELGLPLKFLLEHLEFPNTTDILERIAEESVADLAMEGMKATATAPPPLPGDMPLPMPPATPDAGMVSELEGLAGDLGRLS